MSQTNMWGTGNPPDDVRALPIVVSLPGKIGQRVFGVHHALFENHAEGSRSDMVWIEARTKPEYVVDATGQIRKLKGGEDAPPQSEFILHFRWPSKLLYLLLKEAEKYG